MDAYYLKQAGLGSALNNQGNKQQQEQSTNKKTEKIGGGGGRGGRRGKRDTIEDKVSKVFQAMVTMGAIDDNGKLILRGRGGRVSVCPATTLIRQAMEKTCKATYSNDLIHHMIMAKIDPEESENREFKRLLKARLAPIQLDRKEMEERKKGL